MVAQNKMMFEHTKSWFTTIANKKYNFSKSKLNRKHASIQTGLCVANSAVETHPSEPSLDSRLELVLIQFPPGISEDRIPKWKSHSVNFVGSTGQSNHAQFPASWLTYPKPSACLWGMYIEETKNAWSLKNTPMLAFWHPLGILCQPLTVFPKKTPWSTGIPWHSAIALPPASIVRALVHVRYNWCFIDLEVFIGVSLELTKLVL